MAKTELRCEVEIAAPVERVYRVLTDLPRYELWNPFLVSVQGELAAGRRLLVEMSLPEGKTYLLKPELLRVTENAELRWRSRFLSGALLEVEHFFQLTERRAGVTRVLQGQNFSGFLLNFGRNALTLSARGCVYLNQALKKRAESTQSALD
jgi:hypothetical protein